MKEFEKWFKKADSDLKTIQLCLVSSAPPCDTCCFHSQQAAEKYLKAYLVTYNIDFPKTHDLIALMSLCKNKNSKFGQLEKLCDNLTDYGVSPRYPDETDELTIEDAKQAYADALAIKEFVINHFFE